MPATQPLSDVVIRTVARMIAEGRHGDLDRGLLDAYAARTGLPVPPSETPGPAPVVAFAAHASHGKDVRTVRPRSPRIDRLMAQEGQARGFLKLMRTPLTDELLGDKNALHLLTVIGLRARWNCDPNLKGLSFGQALIGDCRAIDMTPKEYQCARDRLRKWGLVSFDGKSGVGTVATLLDSRVFSLTDERNTRNQEEPNGQHKGELFSEENLQNGGSNGAASTEREGENKGETGGINQKGRRAEGSENNTERSSAKPEQARDRNPLFDALAEATGNKLSELVGSPARACGVALASIRKATPDVTPEEIHRRAQNYATHFDAALTPSALANQWAKCHAAKGGSGRQLSPEFNRAF